MSANDQIVIVKVKEGAYEAHYNGCVDNEFVPSKGSVIAKGKTHEEVTENAREWYNRDDGCGGPSLPEPEYGIVYRYSTKTVEA